MTMDRTTTAAIDETRLNELVGRFLGDLGAALHATTVVVGDKLGLYKALAEGPATAAELAARTGTNERLVQEWLNTQLASGYCERDGERYLLTPEQTAVLAAEDGPAFLVGAMTLAGSVAKDEAKICEAFRSGRGLGWHEHHHDLFHGTERFFKPGYLANLVSSWIPALEGVEAKLQQGAKVADLGCGHGASTILLAQAYPNATIVGFDYHPDSIDEARKRAADAGVADRVSFEVASAQEFPGKGYDLVCVFDALHDMGDPSGAATHIASALADDGTLLFVEPMAGETSAENMNPLGRIYYAASTTICTPAAQNQPGGYALGAQVPESTWRSIMADSGFSRFRRATETPVNRVFEVRR